MSKRVEPIRFCCAKCHRLGADYDGSVTLQSDAVLRLALPKNWRLETEECESHKVVSFVCPEHSAEAAP